MKTNFTALARLALLVLIALPAFAGEGHDHGAISAAGGPAQPRFAAASDLFELVGVIEGRQLTVYLDRFADNAPVQGARIELEMGGVKVNLKEGEPGRFEATLAHGPKPGMTPVTAMVVAGNDSDLLAADLDVHGAAAEVAHEHGWRESAGWAAGALAFVAAATWGLRRGLWSQRSRTGGAA